MGSLASSPLFNALSESELAMVQEVVREIKFSPDQQIFKQGDPGDGIYIVKEGTVQISSCEGQGEARVLTRFKPGDFFGEMAVVENAPRSATAMAEEATSVYFISSEDLLSLVDKIPKLSLFLLRDISRRLRAFDRQYLQDVLQSERLALIGRFARSIIHDLKNPLQIIGLSAEMVGNEAPAARTLATNRIRKQIQRINSMVNELLDFSRGAGEAITLTRLDYGVFVTQIIEDISPEVSAKAISLELENPPPPFEVALHPERLSRVFHNLIHNAMDAMGEGGKIILRFQLADKIIVTELEDTGPGISPEIAEKLFQAFATHGKAHGTGLGLSICKKIIEDHGGKIHSRAEPGKGAIFVFTLPLS